MNTIIYLSCASTGDKLPVKVEFNSEIELEMEIHKTTISINLDSVYYWEFMGNIAEMFAEAQYQEEYQEYQKEYQEEYNNQ